MPESISFNDYQKVTTKKLTFTTEESDLYLVALLNEECGEVGKLFRKSAEHKQPIDLNSLELELGDVLWTISCIARLKGIPLEQIVDSNLNKLQERNLL
jgi:NTP pyrophosphatase (non-canonical NTP hydrolase)